MCPQELICWIQRLFFWHRLLFCLYLVRLWHPSFVPSVICAFSLCYYPTVALHSKQHPRTTDISLAWQDARSVSLISLLSFSCFFIGFHDFVLFKQGSWTLSPIMSWHWPLYTHFQICKVHIFIPVPVTFTSNFSTKICLWVLKNIFHYF